MADQYDEGQQEEYEDQGAYSKPKLGNTLSVWGNPRTMNLNHLVLTNIQNSSYFKVRLFELKTYHEVVDEIYYKVEHLEPWERGTRKTAGQTGMCGGVRGVGAGGVVSTAFCCLFKLFTLKLTRKQANGLLNHTDSPYIRGLGVMYVRYTQPPKDLWDWFEYLMDDEEEIDVKSGGGCVMTIGSMVKTVLTKLDWFSTLFPRIPVPIEKQIHENLKAREGEKLSEAQQNLADKRSMEREQQQQQQSSADRHRSRERSRSHRKESKQRSPEHRRRRSRSPDDQRKSKRSRSRDRRRDSRERKSSRSRDRPRRSRSREKRRRSRSKSRDRHRSYRSR